MKKIIYLTTVVLVSTLFFSGCSKQEAVSESDAFKFNESGYPLTDETVTLSAVFNCHPNTIDFSEMESFQGIEEKTNVKLDVELVRSGWSEKKNLILASGDLPDVFFGQGLDDMDILNNKSYFVDMSGMIDEFAPNIQTMFTEMPVTRKIATVPGTGEIFGLSSVRPFRPKVGDTWFINTSWLDNIGMEAPVTLEDFKAVLTAFRDEDANGNGDTADEIPFNFDGSGGIHFTWKANILGAFGVTSDKFGTKAQIRDGEVQFTPILEGYKSAVAYMAGLFDEGLVYSEAFTQTNYLNTGKAVDRAQLGVGVQWQAQTIFGPWADQYAVLPPFAGPDGTRQITQNPDNIRLNKNMFSITKDNPSPELTMRWINEFYEESNSIQMFFGSIGPAIEQTGDRYVVLDPPADSNLSAGSWKWTMAPADRAPMYCSDDLERRTTVPAFHLTKLSYDEVVAPYVEPKDHSFPMVMWPPEVTEELSMLKNDIFTFVDNKSAEWIVNGNIEEEWDSYVERLHNMGLDRLIEIYQQAYDLYQQS